MNLPYMTAATGKNRKQIIAFAGLNYGQGAGDGELAESWGLSSARFPCLSQRDGRKTAGRPPFRMPEFLLSDQYPICSGDNGHTEDMRLRELQWL